MSACQVCDAKADGFACRHCLTTLERAIGDMTSLMHEVSVVATRQTHVYRAGGPSKKPEEPPAEPERTIPAWLRSRDGRIALRPTQMPVDLDAADLLWVAGNTLSTWTRHIAASRDLELPTAEEMIGWLLTNVETVRWDEAAGQIIEEITGLHRDLERAVDRSPSRIYAGPCAECKVDLYAPWRPGSDEFDDRDEKEFTCDGYRSPEDGCGETYTWSARRPWLASEIRGAMVTIDALIDALPDLFPDLPVPPQASFRGWVRDGRLMDHGRDRVGDLLFIGGDVLDLVERYKPKRFAPRRRRVA